jgi:hypothetical protein
MQRLEHNQKQSHLRPRLNLRLLLPLNHCHLHRRLQQQLHKQTLLLLELKLCQLK